MLKIAFLVTFCGLLARMAQAQATLSNNRYPVAVSCGALNTPIANGVPKEYILPLPSAPVTDQTGTVYKDLKLASPPVVKCGTRTQKGGTVVVTIIGTGTATGNIGGPKPTDGVPCDITNTVEAPFEIAVTDNGGLKCKAPPSTDMARVTCSSKEQSGGLLSGLLGVIVGLLDGLLSFLNDLLKGVLYSVLPDLLKTVQDLLNDNLKKMTDPKPVDDDMICSHKVVNMTTDDNSYLNMIYESTLHNSDGMAETPASGSYPVSPLTPVPGAACTYMLPVGLINVRIQRYIMNTIEIIGGVLDALTLAIKSVCGMEIICEKIVFIPTGILTVEITDGKVIGSIHGILRVFVKGNPAPFMEATVTLKLLGSFEYKSPRIYIKLNFDSVVNVKLVSGPPSCDVSQQASETCMKDLKGKVCLQKPIEGSPVGNLPLSGSTKFTPKNGCVEVAHY